MTLAHRLHKRDLPGAIRMACVGFGGRGAGHGSDLGKLVAHFVAQHNRSYPLDIFSIWGFT
jgi:hypothetical protein